MLRPTSAIPIFRRAARAGCPVRSRPIVVAAILLLVAAPAGAQSDAARVRPRPAAAVATPATRADSPAVAQANPAAPAGGRLAAFERRRASGRGVFISRTDLARRRSGRLSDVLRGVPGILLVRFDGMGFAVAATRPGLQPRLGMDGSGPRAQACYLDVLLDGVRLTPSPNVLPVDIDDIAPSRLAGIEIHRATAIPAELPVGAGSCGVIALWSAEP